MNTLTASRLEQAPLSETAPPLDQLGADPFFFQSFAIGALIMTAVGIALTGDMDLCSSFGPIVLMVAWFVLPIGAIASIAGAATSTHRTAERYLTAFAAVGFTAMWLFGLVWAQVGHAIDRVAC
ncbi:MAG: hypothetical protein V3S28_01850 [Acidimicrobiia bacterium]